jgi:hypothetical protein
VNAKRKSFIVFVLSCHLILPFAAWQLSAQQAVAPDATGKPQELHNQIAELTPENRALFDALREAVQHEHDADVLTDGKKLLPALKTDTPLADFVTQLTAGAAVETGDTERLAWCCIAGADLRRERGKGFTRSADRTSA